MPWLGTTNIAMTTEPAVAAVVIGGAPLRCRSRRRPLLGIGGAAMRSSPHGHQEPLHDGLGAAGVLVGAGAGGVVRHPYGLCSGDPAGEQARLGFEAVRPRPGGLRRDDGRGFEGRHRRFGAA